MNYNLSFKIGNKKIGINYPAYFIADLAANHNGCLEKAKSLIWQAKEAGADCAKFQHFQAKKIVSKFGFENMNSKISHQANWTKSVSEIYEQYHTRKAWTDELIKTCKDANIEFMTTPYDFDAIKLFSKISSALKIGSGDITFGPALDLASSFDKPILLATGASNMDEVSQAVSIILKKNKNLCLMQCNTNYTNDLSNFKYINLNVLKSYALKWPGLPLGLSDHTPGHTTVVGAITLGARVIEKHFTDNNNQEGPDHKFALNPETWAEMIKAARELEFSLGDGVKKVEDNEIETIIIQRRALRLKLDLKKGTILKKNHLESLRPCNKGDCSPMDLKKVIGKKIKVSLKAGTAIKWEMIN